ncbi:MAG: pyridoxal 5'-phosphate synthase glutaminase subunit PdxT [Desulfobacterales bacterium]|jgi:5'-phosphate synthase pdxT subunit|nr:pyridoxal 5'-phosphate synthase glutaminase subunit PdxT [Deltaproteobacteria bacterium]
MKIGVLALQGAFSEHIHMLGLLGVDTAEVRLPEDLADLDGLIIPGGESTTIGKLAVMYQMLDPLRQFAVDRAVWGTCAGMILMAKAIGVDQPLLGIMDIVVERNAFGRQIDSFKEDLYVNILKNGDAVPFPGIFIRSPKLVQTKGRAVTIARLADGTPVAAIEDRLLATAFHPELTNDTRFHQYFLSLIRPSPS